MKKEPLYNTTLISEDKLKHDIFEINSSSLEIIDSFSEENLSKRELQKKNRLRRLINLPDLSETRGHPINLIVEKINNSPYFEGFDKIKVPEISSEYITFDLFGYNNNHPARNVSDSYFLTKGSNTKDNLLLRPHMSVMRYYYLKSELGKNKIKNFEIAQAMSRGKVYRVDNVDKTHHECFHQLDGLKVISKEKEIINKKTIEILLVNIITSIFGNNIKWRITSKSFPFINDGLEIEILFNGKWIRAIGAGVVNPSVLDNLGLSSEKYNGRAFGLGIERLVMSIKNIPDIRYIWSNDVKIVNQLGDLFSPFIEVSKTPSVYKDISILIPKNDNNESLHLIKDLIKKEAINLVKDIKIVDTFENDNKFGSSLKSITIRIEFNEFNQTLTNEEINPIYFKIREIIEDNLGYTLR